jgi:hypothetical protein
MATFKNAFDTAIVGLLALPWFFVLLEIVGIEDIDSFWTAVRNLGWSNEKGLPSQMFSALPTLGLVSLTYLLGAIAIPLGDEITQEGHPPFQQVNDEYLRANVYISQANQLDALDKAGPWDKRPEIGCETGLLAPLIACLKSHPDSCMKLAKAMYHADESALLVGSDDESAEEARRFRDRKTILRGATIDGFILIAFCPFAWFASLTKQAQKTCKKLQTERVRKKQRSELVVGLLACAVVLALLVFGAWAWPSFHVGGQKQSGPVNSHAVLVNPPSIEILSILVALLGAFSLLLNVSRSSENQGKSPEPPSERLEQSKDQPSPLAARPGVWGLIIVVATGLTALSVLAWVWTETRYDTLILRSRIATCVQPPRTSSAAER